MQIKIYLDDVRTPTDPEWTVVRTYHEFCEKVEEIGLKNIAIVSLDHDLDESAMVEYYNNVSPNYTLDYNNIKEPTGFHAAKWLVDHFYQTSPEWSQLPRAEKRKAILPVPIVLTHSANPIGSANIMGIINNFLMNEAQPQSCSRIQIEHTLITK